MAFVPFIAVRNFPRFRSDAPTINSHQCDVFPRRRLTRVTVHNTSAVRASANQAEEPMKLTYFDTRVCLEAPSSESDSNRHLLPIPLTPLNMVLPEH